MTKNDKIDDISKSIIEYTDEKVTNILEVLDINFEDMYFLLIRLTDEEKDQVINIVINKLLEQLKSTITLEKCYEIREQVDRVTSFCVSQKNDFDIIIEEGNHIANEILFKVISCNELFNLPIDIIGIKKYGLSSKIGLEQVYDVLFWIIIRYIAIIKCLTWQK